MNECESGLTAYSVTAEELPAEQYHTRPEYSVSQLKLLPQQPELFWGYYVSKQWKREPSASMDLGSIVHAVSLENKPTPIIPEEVLSKSGSRAGKAWDEYQKSHPGPLLKAKDAEPVKWMVDSIRNNDNARALLECQGQVELSLVWNHAATGLGLRARLDKLCDLDGTEILVDLKCVSDPTPGKFCWKCADLRYHWQAAMYMRGVAEVFGTPPERFLFITVRNEPPYECVVYEPKPRFLEIGYEQLEEAIRDLAYRLETNNWRSKETDIVNLLDLPQKAIL